APLGREARDGVRADGTPRQLHAGVDVAPSGRLALAVRPQPRHAYVLDVPELLLGPLRARRGLLEETEPPCLLGQIAHGRRALQRDDLTALVAVQRVTPREHRRAGELGVRHLVVVEAALHAQQIAGNDARPVEPPLVAAEDHVRAGDVADDRRTGAVAH